MVETRSKGNERDTRSRTNNSSPTKNSIKFQGTPSSISKGSKSNSSSLASSPGATNTSSLRRSQRETSAKRASSLIGTALQKSRAKYPSSTSNPSNKKTISMEGSSSSSKSAKKKSKGKVKAQAEAENNTQTCKKSLNSNANSDSSSSSSEKKEEGSSTKRRRVLMHAQIYKEFFRPRPVICESSPPAEKAPAVEAPADEVAIAQLDEHVIVDVPVQEASILRDDSSSSKLADEAMPSTSEVNTPKKISIICVESEDEVMDVPPAGSTEKRKVDPGEVVIAGGDALDISDECQTCEEDCGPNVCFACRKPGILLCCEGKGCTRSYHLTCLDPPLQSSPPGTWLCLCCIKKKIQFGPYAVSDGIECVWDAKEARTGNGKQYLVKYKNLAHVHNRWVPEAEVVREAPQLLSKFNWRMQKEKNPVRWKQEWTEPQRLLMKRPLMSAEAADVFFEGPGESLPFCNSEWLVKWRDLGYEDATWELETCPFFCTEDAASLVKAFESRRQRAPLASSPRHISRALEVKQSTLDKLDKLPDGLPPGLDSANHLQAVNQLRVFWHRSENAVFIDEQERVIKTILFIMSVIEDICHPILIVSSATSLPLWESKFQRLAPSVNVVSYTGTEPVRKLIRDVEFFEEGGCAMFQVLLSDPDSMVEDFETLDRVGWEAIIVDGFQNLRISKNLEKFKNLSADFRLLLLSSPIKDNIPDYMNILSYLDPNQDIAMTNPSDKSGTLAALKEKLGHHVVYERKDETSKFVEYWVPVRFSKVQLELYCSTLLSNSLALRSFSKIDHVGALRDMLISLRKCCDHPYLVNQELQTALTKDRPLSEILDIGVYACGKLLLLDKLLHEMRARGLRVLILFQSGGGSGRNQIGDFLDDFLRQKFGAEAYEHVERGLLMSKKQTAMSNFNDKSKGRFVFLIENRACQMSVRLSAVDAVLIYDSDWNPMNDTRTLQRIHVQPERIPVFRLYSPYAVEEKVLSLAKQDVFLDSNLQGVVPAVSHSLLSWGADRLFSQLHQLHCQPDDALESYRSAYLSPEDLTYVNDVVTGILDRVCWKSGDAKAASQLVEVQLSGESYSRDTSPLMGEEEGVASLHGDPSVFWSAFLEGKNPQWRFIQSNSPVQRSRRKVRPFDNSEKPQVAAGPGGGGETEEARKKRKKNGDDTGMGGMGIMFPRGKTGTTVSSRNPSLAVSTWDDITDSSAGPSEQDVSNQAAAFASVEMGANLRSMQRGIHHSLEPQLLKLCQFAGLPEYVKTMAGMLLEYVMNNFKVDDGGDAAILQTLVIALCWRAASLFKHWVDPSQLMALASETLLYNCKADVVESIYGRLKALKAVFQDKADAMLASQVPPVRFYNNLFKVPKQEVITLPDTPFSEEEVVDLTASIHGQSENANGTEADPNNFKDKLLKRQLDLIEMVCTRREEALLTKQHEEVSEMEQYKEREEMRLLKEHQSQLESLSGAGMEEKVTQVKEEFERKMHAFEAHVGKERERLETLHAAARELERSIKEGWVQNSKLGTLEDDFDNVPLTNSGEFVVQEFNWDPPTTTPPLVREENMTERDEDGDIAPGPSNHIPSPSPQETGVVAEEVAPVATALNGDAAAAESTAQHIDGEISSEGSQRDTMMQQETPSVAESNPPAETESTPPPETAESSPSLVAESTPPAERAESAPSLVAESTPPAETAEPTPSLVAELTSPAERAESTPSLVAESTSPAERGESAPLAERAESAPSLVEESTSPDEAAEPTLPAERGESAPSLVAESTPLAERAESAPSLVAESTSPDEAEEPTPSLTEAILPDVVEIDDANGDPMADPSDALLPSDPLASVSRDAPSHPFPQQILGAVPQTLVQLPAQVQDLGRQIAEANMGHGAANGNGTVGARLEASNSPLWQMLPMASPMAFPHGLHADPLRNELTRIKQQEDQMAKRHEAKKLHLKLEMEELLERIRRRYEEMMQEEENTYQRQSQLLDDVYKRVLLNQSLAEEFRAKFIEHRGGPSSSPSPSPSTSAPSQFRNQLSVPRPQLPPQPRAPQQIQRAPSPTAAALARQGSGSAIGSLHIPTNSSRPPSVMGPHIPSSSPLRPSAASPSPSRAPFSSVTLPPRPASAIRTEQRAPAPHLARARPHMSAPVPTSTSNPVPASVSASAMQQLQALLAQTKSQNRPAESSLPSFGNGSGTVEVAAKGDEVVCLSDDD